jgi:hypothetical protein
MHIENMNDLEILLSAFDSTIPQSQLSHGSDEFEEETKNPVF